ncbi:MAG: Asp-tRNA(Asn)/Glu-tRNA(Gln) amidotransferase subunit GatA, partial [Actinobacteria bacterium]|nr:Asp-tRNA(Asn)/Glu-tRNA(Gln) amidotransferase subunit GatA [Actinomycetota bacterium]NIS30610.1 Asp-tRNA(Asn)/Glu-tRNA(Gln) amidotransferase subunit GatA [Actinomycetota bacterium]NIU18847.1 Asp-tRNA(Asn)/Glu-tRNA(Gln) amidotransferase subunit GatA [Actinomycetota bacterium]NIU65816.1 Asp-tRNA(Asn)/Glu-tRNA(Gln) amidotransferase subunit GatA [Actinomycetota bacterium]NIX20135.1 Asp-tRNA(Asn)/Glu-tRNA(Gln) amidotransferase subunit GatA [Actinomycetota bacterium]
MSDPADLTIAEARTALDSGALSAVDLLDAVLKRVSITEAHLHAYLTLDREGARAAAEASDRR